MLFETIEIVGRASGPHLLISAGVHGDEWEPMLAVRRLIEMLRPEQMCGQVTLAPILNVSAFKAGQRTGEDHLDLARTFPGAPEGTLTQRVAFEFTQLLRTADYYIDLHTGGLRLTIWPLAGYLLHHNAEVLEKQRLMAHAFGLPAVWGTDGTVEGRTISAARDLSVPAIYAEYLGSAVFREETIASLVTGCERVMSAIGINAEKHPATKPRFFAEDPAPGSGNLQACYPAPDSGLFEPHVSPGQLVTSEDAIGTLTCDKWQTQILRAGRNGRVVAIRTLPRVKAGESLAVIASFEELGA